MRTEVLTLSLYAISASNAERSRADAPIADRVEHRRRTSVMASGARVQADLAGRLLTPVEVAAAFPVHPKTVTRWAKAGKLSSVRTLGGHRRYREAEVRGLLTAGTAARPSRDAWRWPGRVAVLPGCGPGVLISFGITRD